MPSIQERILKRIEAQLPKGESLAKSLERFLEVDSSTARRKLHGDSNLSLEQLESLIAADPSLLEELLPIAMRDNNFLGTYSHIHSYNDVAQYLRSIIKRFELAVKAEAKLQYIARDLPLFFFLSDRDLASFKFSLWTGELQKGNLIQLCDELYQLCQEAHQLYLSLSTVEIWSREVTRNQLQQLNWHWGMTYLDPKIKEGLLEVIKDKVATYKEWAYSGLKDGKGKLQLYFSEYIVMNNGGLLSTDRFKVLMSAISNVNFVSYTNPSLCEGFLKEFEDQQNASILVSRSNALEREKSFSKLIEDLNS